MAFGDFLPCLPEYAPRSVAKDRNPVGALSLHRDQGSFPVSYRRTDFLAVLDRWRFRLSLWSQLDEEIETRNTSGLAKSRAKAALKTLKSVLGSGFVLADKDVLLAEFVDVPGESTPWIVFGVWEDGTCDIVREGGMFSGDTMTGWKRGQSVREYRADLKKEFPDGEDDPSTVGGTEDVPEGSRKGLAVLPGGGVRGSKRQPGREARHHARRGEDRGDQGPASENPVRRTAAESVVPGSGSARTDS